MMWRPKLGGVHDRRGRGVLLPIVGLAVVLCGSPARAATVYSQPPAASGALLQSSWWDPDGSDYDQYVWDAFVLGADAAITQIRWRGGYDPTRFGSGGPVIDFTIAIYPSIPAGIQPNVVNPPLADYQAGGSASETPAGSIGGTPMYDYTFTLPVPFHASAGTKYWVQIEAWQHGIPDWSMAAGAGGDGSYFRRIANVGDIFYQTVSGDAAFTLLSAGGPTDTATPTATPQTTLTATPQTTLTATSTSTVTATPTTTPTPPVCDGDCNGDGSVTINELISGVTIALGAPVDRCRACDTNRDQAVTVNELVAAVGHALHGC
jgi:hypothetical protein